MVSEAELARRRLLAAQERLARASASARAMNARITAANKTFAELNEPLLRVEPPKTADPDTWEHEASRLESGVASVEGRLSVRTAELRAVAFSQGLGGLLSASFAPDGPATRKNRATAVQATSHLMQERLRTTLALLPPGSACEHECDGLAAKWIQEPSDGRRELILTQIKHLVQEEADRRKAGALRKATLETLLRQLDGLVSDEIQGLKQRIERHALTEDVPAELLAAVSRAAASARSELDRHFVLDAVSDVLSKLGYQVGESFGTAVAEGGAVLDLTSSPQHGVQVREHAGQLLFNVVRFRDPRDSSADKRAEELFCQDFSALRAQLDSRGVALNMTRADPPGATTTQLISRSRPAEKRDGDGRGWDEEHSERAR